MVLLLVLTRSFNQPTSPKEDPAIAQLQAQIEKERLLNEKLRLTGLPGDSRNPEALVAQIKADSEALARLVNKSNSDAAMLRSTQADLASLRRRNEDLSSELEKNRAAALRAQDLQRQLNQIRQDAQGMVDQAEVNRVRSELDLVKTDRDRLQDELTRLRSQQQDMVDSSLLAQLRTELEQLRERNIILRAENQRLLTELDGAKLFVTGEDLSPRAVALYRALKSIEEENHLKRRETYESISTQLSAAVRETIAFKTGQATVAREHESHLAEIVANASEKSFFLVVGYASTSGDSQNNEELSSQRATRVASMVNRLRKEGQAVQAVYLGEGKRFGPEDAVNQVCEVWEIDP
jgi:outer membrane protein OmpA-like peptidoglycan-associated protein